MDKDLYAKFNTLKELLHEYKRIAIAFSAGVDSTFLLKVARDTLGENAVAITTFLSSFPDRDRKEAANFCCENNIHQIVTEIDELSIDGFMENPKNRCYICKKTLFTNMVSVAAMHGFDLVVDGSNTDDDSDYRPGLRALCELGIKSPLKLAGLSKSDIRSLSKELGLNTADKPSFACLSTRIPYGEIITKEKLSIIEHGEQLLYDLGFEQFRVRLHGGIARIEIYPNDFPKILSEDIRNQIINTLSDLGVDYVTLDLKGFNSGSMNLGINK